MRIIWSPLAVERIEEIGYYIATDNLEAALLWTESVFDQIHRLKKFPKSGRVVPEVKSPNIREIIYGNYRIIYRIEQKVIAVLTVRHSREFLTGNEFL